ncbi:DUF4179 domain-containing protein [Planococcus shixiaomingii]|uniref:DUF4179 domain-containing protein n=1 Tax=Planococcus shixiaomingii TaxID=3058393 RepID=UPI00260ACC1A|nr:DUF4179 domain-containing protein [Planococcus sp. N022]WKA56141.1 DUF4179 domain-containing protein [Planococcus sp. N022]
MFEKEEKNLNRLKMELENTTLPLEKADGAILRGMEQAKVEKRRTRTKRIRSLWTIAATAILMVALIGTIRVSPAFAHAVASIPGMEKFVSFVQHDKGLNAVFENDYYQPINVTQEKDGLTLKVEGVILDESGMNIFYSVTSQQSLEAISIQKPELHNQQKIPPGSISYGYPHNGKDPYVYHDRIDYHFVDSVKFDDLSFKFDVTVLLNGHKTLFSVPIEVPENVRPNIVYAVNEEVEIESQKITIKEIIVSPLRVGVKISVDLDNSKKILNFEDLRLEDENGEIWGSIRNGISATGAPGSETIYYLQSNYFEQPKELYLQINKIQALDKEEAFLEVDTEKNKLIRAPNDGRLTLGTSEKSRVEFFLADIPEDEQNHELILSILDAEGKSIEISSALTEVSENQKRWDIGFGTSSYTNPLRLELVAYPNYIEGDVKIKLSH